MQGKSPRNAKMVVWNLRRLYQVAIVERGSLQSLVINNNNRVSQYQEKQDAE